MIMKKQIQKSTFFKEKYQNNDDDFFVGNKFDGDPKHLESKKRITKRREHVISLLSKFSEESNVIEKQVKQISTELKTTEKEIIKKMDELKTELERHKEQLNAITEISNNYIDMVCEKFNVKRENIEKIRIEKR